RARGADRRAQRPAARRADAQRDGDAGLRPAGLGRAVRASRPAGAGGRAPRGRDRVDSEKPGPQGPHHGGGGGYVLERPAGVRRLRQERSHEVALADQGSRHRAGVTNRDRRGRPVYAREDWMISRWLVPQTRSSHRFAAGTVANFGIGTLALLALASLPVMVQQAAAQDVPQIAYDSVPDFLKLPADLNLGEAAG